MNKALNGVIKELKKQLAIDITQIDWYQKQLKEFEMKVINIKETIAELEAIKYVSVYK